MQISAAPEVAARTVSGVFAEDRESETGADEMKTVAVLCVAPRTIYRSLEAVEVYDRRRDARTFAGGMPIIAHPPCRGWSAKTRHQAKPEPGEMNLGFLCADWLRKCGGILEQPAWSHLFDAAGLPIPPHQSADGNLWSIQIEQYWWGFPTPKPTWLCFSGIDPSEVHLPFRLRNRGSRKRNRYDTWSRLTATKRSRTIEPFARWLVALARAAKTQDSP